MEKALEFFQISAVINMMMKSIKKEKANLKRTNSPCIHEPLTGDMNMITFNGSQKEFFKAYPKEKRSLNETYKLINSTGEIEYKFVGGLGEKCFKKFVKNDTELKETEDTKTKESKPERKIIRKWEKKWEEKYGRSFEEMWSEMVREYGFTTSNTEAYHYLKDAYDNIQDVLTDEEKICCEHILEIFKVFGKLPTEDYYDFFVKVSKRIKNLKIKKKWNEACVSYVYYYCDSQTRLESSYKDFERTPRDC